MEAISRYYTKVITLVWYTVNFAACTDDQILWRETYSIINIWGVWAPVVTALLVGSKLCVRLNVSWAAVGQSPESTAIRIVRRHHRLASEPSVPPASHASSSEVTRMSSSLVHPGSEQTCHIPAPSPLPMRIYSSSRLSWRPSRPPRSSGLSNTAPAVLHRPHQWQHSPAQVDWERIRTESAENLPRSPRRRQHRSPCDAAVLHGPRSHCRRPSPRHRTSCVSGSSSSKSRSDHSSDQSRTSWGSCVHSSCMATSVEMSPSDVHVDDPTQLCALSGTPATHTSVTSLNHYALPTLAGFWSLVHTDMRHRIITTRA